MDRDCHEDSVKRIVLKLWQSWIVVEISCESGCCPSICKQLQLVHTMHCQLVVDVCGQVRVMLRAQVQHLSAGRYEDFVQLSQLCTESIVDMVDANARDQIEQFIWRSIQFVCVALRQCAHPTARVPQLF